MKIKTARIPMMMEPEMVEVIDDWAFAKRVRTRAAAIRLLIEKGLAAEDHENEKGEAA